MKWQDDVSAHEALLARAIEAEGKDEALLAELGAAAHGVCPEWSPPVPERWPTFARQPEKEYSDQWMIRLQWAANELLRTFRGEGRAKGLGGDNWRSYRGDDWFADAQWKELAKCVRLLEQPPAFETARPAAVVVEDAMTSDTALWDIPRGLAVDRHPEHGAQWCGKTDKLVWNPTPTSGAWLWLGREIEDGFVFTQRFRTLGGVSGGGLLIMAFCARPLDAQTSWEHASGPTMAYYYNYFDSYHFSVSRAHSGYCNLRRCGPGLVMLASGGDPTREEDRWYETVIVKRGGIIDLYVDGELVNSHLDCGLLAPRLDRGRIGFRHVQRYVAQHRDVRVQRLA